ASTVVSSGITCHPPREYSSVKWMTPSRLPQLAAITAGTPLIRPRALSTLGMVLNTEVATPGLGNTSCECPSTIASIPGTWLRYQLAFSMVGDDGLGSTPLCASATTRSAPADRISGTSSLAASTIPVAYTFPSRLRLSQVMTCGGVKPMTPTWNGTWRFEPSGAVASKVRERRWYGSKMGASPEAERTLESTSG